MVDELFDFLEVNGRMAIVFGWINSSLILNMKPIDQVSSFLYSELNDSKVVRRIVDYIDQYFSL